MKMHRGFKVRIYPNKNQEKELWKQIYGCRFIWNYLINLQQTRYKNKEKHLSEFEMCRVLPELKEKKEYSWLKEVSARSMQIICGDLSRDYSNFFKKKGNYPKFKTKKKAKNKYPVDGVKLWFDEKNYVHIPKIGKVKFKTDFNIPTGSKIKIINPRIEFTYMEKWMLSFSLEIEKQNFELNEFSIGVDLGIKETAVVSYDGKSLVYHNINKSKEIRRIDKQLRHVYRTMCRKFEHNREGNKYYHTNNINKEIRKIRRLFNRKNGIKYNYLHQMTHEIVSLKPKRIVMEDLNVSRMLKNKHLSHAIQEQCFYEIKDKIRYKCEEMGIEFVEADRFYPSSKICSCCGEVKKKLLLSERTYKCEYCGLTIDRDLNAAKNLEKYKI